MGFETTPLRFGGVWMQSRGDFSLIALYYGKIYSVHTKVFQTPKLPLLGTEWIEPCEGAWKTEPENDSFSSVC